MTDAALTSTPPAPGGGAPPAGGDAPPPTLKRPDWLPEAHWDGQTNAIKPEFGAHYAELSTFHQTETERQAALKARKPEDIKIALPEGFRAPDGIKPEQIKINEKDPRIPLLRDFAQKHGISQEAVADLVAFDAQLQIDAYNAETARLAEETKKLGEKATERTAAVDNVFKGMKDRGEITAEEYESVRAVAVTAAGVSALEKIIGKLNGSVPGSHVGDPPAPPKPGDIPGYDTMTFEQRRAAQWNKAAAASAA